MERKNKDKQAPSDESVYKINFIFKEDSDVDVNEVLKKSFLSELENITNHS